MANNMSYLGEIIMCWSKYINGYIYLCVIYDGVL
jgi:hypothetical protein